MSSPAPAVQCQTLFCILNTEVIECHTEATVYAHFLFSFSGILLAATSIGPAFGFITGSVMLRFYVDFDKFSKGERSQ